MARRIIQGASAGRRDDALPPIACLRGRRIRRRIVCVRDFARWRRVRSGVWLPQARGRSERMFGTLQKRLPQELRLAGIATMAEANRFLEELFWPAHNARFARPAADTGSAFVAFAGTLEDILCAQEDRVVAGDNTVRYKNRTLQIPADRHRHHYVKAQVRVHEYPDGHLAVFHGPRCLARYRADGETIDDDRLQAA